MAKRGEKRSRAIRETVGEGVIAFLRTGIAPPGDAETYLWKIEDEKVKAAWKTVGADLLAEHVKKFPGSRPWAWWEFDAPERRLRVGGTGTPRHEAFPTKNPRYRFGVPQDWIVEREVNFYLRRGRIIGKAFDENDPPTFESEPAYLRRLGLLLPGEEKRLKDSDFAPVPVTFDEASS